MCGAYFIYHDTISDLGARSLLWDSNPRPSAYRAGALPAKLKMLMMLLVAIKIHCLIAPFQVHTTIVYCEFRTRM